MAAVGPVSLSRAAHPLTLPAAQGWIMTSGQPPPSYEAPIPGPVIGVAGHRGYGYQWAPGQGGDTPGAGGAGVPGGDTSVVTQDAIVRGYAIPASVTAHVPGTVGWIGVRRSGA